MLNIVKNCRVSNYINFWKVTFPMVGSYAIMPTHCAIFKKENDNKWQVSEYLKMCNGNTNSNKLRWFTTKKWLDMEQLENDIAWAKLPEIGFVTGSGIHSNTYLQSTSYVLDSSDSVDAMFYFHQPYDYKGNLCEQASLGRMLGIVYNSPNSKMLEATNIGFKGMSGSIAVSEFGYSFGGLVGMFVGRGTDLGVTGKDMARGIIMPPNVMTENIMSNCTIELEKIEN